MARFKRAYPRSIYIRQGQSPPAITAYQPKPFIARNPVPQRGQAGPLARAAGAGRTGVQTSQGTAGPPRPFVFRSPAPARARVGPQANTCSSGVPSQSVTPQGSPSSPAPRPVIQHLPPHRAKVGPGTYLATGRPGVRTPLGFQSQPAPRPVIVHVPPARARLGLRGQAAGGVPSAVSTPLGSPSQPAPRPVIQHLPPRRAWVGGSFGPYGGIGAPAAPAAQAYRSKPFVFRSPAPRGRGSATTCCAATATPRRSVPRRARPGHRARLSSTVRRAPAHGSATTCCRRRLRQPDLHTARVAVFTAAPPGHPAPSPAPRGVARKRLPQHHLARRRWAAAPVRVAQPATRPRPARQQSGMRRRLPEQHLHSAGRPIQPSAAPGNPASAATAGRVARTGVPYRHPLRHPRPTTQSPDLPPENHPRPHRPQHSRRRYRQLRRHPALRNIRHHLPAHRTADQTPRPGTGPHRPRRLRLRHRLPDRHPTTRRPVQPGPAPGHPAPSAAPGRVARKRCPATSRHRLPAETVRLPVAATRPRPSRQQPAPRRRRRLPQHHLARRRGTSRARSRSSRRRTPAPG